MYAWTSAYAIGIPHLDAQHQQLFELIAQLHQAMLNGRSKLLMDQVLAKLVNYTVGHFGAEEALMRARNYSGMTEHLLFHEQFAAKIRRFEQQYKAGKAPLTVELMDMLQDWLVTHIMNIDIEVARELKAA